MPNVIDHSVAALLLVLWPTLIAIYGRRDMQTVADEPARRFGMYVRTILIQWAHVLAITVVWVLEERPWSELGLGTTVGWGFGAALVIAAVLTAAMTRQLNRVREDSEVAARLRGQADDLRGLLPDTPRELRGFRAMALTASICEEVAYRGFLLWYLGAYVHPAAAVALMAFAFGCSHLYQGAQAASQIAVIATVAALLYHLSGSLWIPIVLHAILDLWQLALVRAAFSSEGAASRPG